jgi:protein required for attachment to host cells
LVRNLNLDFNVVRVQAIMKTIQCMTPDGSPLAVLTQQGAEAANLIVAKKSTDIPRREPSIDNNDRARRARSEAASSASPNHRMSEHDARECIT